MYHELIYLLLSQSCANRKRLLDHISRSSIVEVKIEHLTSNWFTAWIRKPRVVVGQFLPTAEGANPSMGKFLDAVTHPKIDGAEFGYPLYQSDQARCHIRFPSLLIDKRGVQLLVHPLRLDMHINQESLRLRTLPQAPEGSINVFMNAVMTK
jgi:hypothetical protein